MTVRHVPPLPDHRIEIRLAGSGGQGVILAGLVLAEAAGIFDGREVAMTQSYGPEARGGSSKAEVILSDTSIDYPLCTSVDVLLALTQEASDTYSWDLKPDARIIVDSDLVRHPPSSRAVGFPFTALARDKLKRIMVANIVALGAISELTGLVTRRALERALQTKVPPGTAELNRKALNLGTKLAGEYVRMQQGEVAGEPGTEDL